MRFINWLLRAFSTRGYVHYSEKSDGSRRIVAAWTTQAAIRAEME